MAHLVRRGAVYHWRRRFGGPALGCPARVITLSLSTKEKALARRRGAELTHRSETLFEEVRQRRLTGEEARAMLVVVARKQMDKLARHAAYDRQRSTPEPMSGEGPTGWWEPSTGCWPSAGGWQRWMRATVRSWTSCGLGP